ncbi:PP2C family protein-serine/threonine phosphatase [Streptomyces sp. NPDC058953]|uniref:PP2C family protein-serine/threonine phosphatase n=1 Tax=unclassified Streptomyces TaxID=2593676 RepID=UPI0036BB44AC
MPSLPPSPAAALPSSCPRCGGPVAPDGHCWDCGHVRPGFRARLEVAVASGAAGVGDRGLRREINADALALAAGPSGEWTVGVVADGVSMAPRAERAARIAADTAAAVAGRLLTAGELPESALYEALRRAGRAVTALAAGAGPAPATTCVVGAVGPVAPLTRDDSGRHEALTAWLGADAGECEPEVVGRRPREAGRLILCSDGLWRCLARPGESGVPAVRPRADTPLDDARALVRYALDAGGEDNITVVVIPVTP